MDPSPAIASRVQYRVWDDDTCAEVVGAALRVLEKTGCRVLGSRAKALLKDAGCLVDDERVRIPAPLMREAIAGTPSSIALYDRHGETAMELAPHMTHFGPPITTTFVVDLDTGVRRQATARDAADAALVCDALDHVAWSSGSSLVSDDDGALADLRELRAILPNTAKPVAYWSYDAEHLTRQFEMLEAVAGSPERLREKPFAVSLSSPLDPLVHTEEGLAQLMFLAERGAPSLYVPGIQFGLTGPATLAGGIVVGLADLFVGLLVAQLTSPGAPFIAAKFNDNLDFARLTVSHSGPDAALAHGASADVFRHLGLPFCVNLGNTDAGALDQVAASDAALHLYTAALCGSNMVMMGSFEAGNLTNLAGLVFADELLSTVARLVAGVEVSEETLAEDVIEQVGPGGSFVGVKHTRRHYRELWRPSVLKGRGYDQWADAGRPDLAATFTERAREIVAAGPQDPLDEGVVEELDAILARAERGLRSD